MTIHKGAVHHSHHGKSVVWRNASPQTTRGRVDIISTTQKRTRRLYGGKSCVVRKLYAHRLGASYEA
jgi:hypothetical protein